MARRGDEERLFFSHVEFQQFIADLEREVGRELLVVDERDPGGEGADVVVREFRKSRGLRTAVDRLQTLGFDAVDYVTGEEGNGGQAICRLEYNGTEEEISSLQEVLEGVRRAGKKGIDVARYKGLGEMNPDQLRETTMDPETRKLIQVRSEDAMEADRIFSILMGPDVEPRREFIEKHALDVKDLDI
jgi:DNA gyrase subunit B